MVIQLSYFGKSLYSCHTLGVIPVKFPDIQACLNWHDSWSHHCARLLPSARGAREQRMTNLKRSISSLKVKYRNIAIHSAVYILQASLVTSSISHCPPIGDIMYPSIIPTRFLRPVVSRIANVPIFSRSPLRVSIILNSTTTYFSSLPR